MHPRQELKQLTDLLLSDESHWGERRECLQEMHRLFVDLNHFNAYEPAVKVDEEWLPNGCAISPRGAAMCLFEITRTRLFVKGIVAAIHQLLKEQKTRPLQILDAGCGPYALLSLLAAQYFTAEEAQFHLLDIHETNIDASKILIEALDMTDKFGSYVIADACTYPWAPALPLHLVITETMLNGLRKEPQVSITLNLSRQLAAGGLLIPEQVAVDLVQLNNSIKNKIMQTAIDTGYYGELDFSDCEKKLSNIVTLTKETTVAHITRKPLATIMLPADHEPDFHCLQFHTTITVFDKLVMHHSDSSLTLPLHFSQPNKNPIAAGRTISFSYNASTNPGIEFEFLN